MSSDNNWKNTHNRNNSRDNRISRNDNRRNIYRDKLKDIQNREEYKKGSEPEYKDQSKDFPKLSSVGNSQTTGPENSSDIGDKSRGDCELSQKITLTEEQNRALREEDRKRSRQKMLEQEALKTKKLKSAKSKTIWYYILNAQHIACLKNTEKSRNASRGFSYHVS